MMNPTEWIDPQIANWIVIALGHVLWQGVVLAGLAGIVALGLRDYDARWRYGVHCGALLLTLMCWPINMWLTAPALEGAMPSVVTVLDDGADVRNNPAPAVLDEAMNFSVLPEDPASMAHVQEAAVDAVPPSSITGNFAAGWPTVSPWLVTLYVLGTVLMGLRLVVGLYGSQRLRCSADPVKGTHLHADLVRLAKHVGLQVIPVIAMSARVTTPLVVGVLKPAILLPPAILSGLRPEQVEALLLHELAHIRRYDHVVNLLQRIVETLLFFHPAVWWLSNKISVEREHCCDDLAIQWGGDACEYAESLVRVSELRYQAAGLAPQSATVLAATGGQPSHLQRRVLRVLGVPLAGPTIGLTRLGLATLVVLTLSTAMIIANQNPNTSSEEPLEPATSATPEPAAAPGPAVVAAVADDRPSVEPSETVPSAHIRKRHFVRVVVGKKPVAVNGQICMGKLEVMLKAIPDRAHTVLEYATTPDGDQRLQDEVFKLALQLGFEYFSFTGTHPLHATGSPTEYVVCDPKREAALQAIIRDIQRQPHRERVQVVLLPSGELRIEGHLIEREQLLRVLRSFPTPTKKRLQVIRMVETNKEQPTLSRFLGNTGDEGDSRVLWKVIAEALGFAEVRWETVDSSDKYWDLKLALLGVWSGPGPEPLSLIFNPGGRYLTLQGESGTWQLEGRVLHRSISSAPDSQQIGRQFKQEVIQLDDRELVLKAGNETLHLYRAIDFYNLTLQRFQSTTDPSDLPDLFEDKPVGSKSYSLREEVQIVYNAIDGTVYYRPDTSTYYVQTGALIGAQLRYYGPYRGDPRQSLDLPPEGIAAAQQLAAQAAKAQALQQLQLALAQQLAAAAQKAEHASATEQSSKQALSEIEKQRIKLAELQVKNAEIKLDELKKLEASGRMPTSELAQAEEDLYRAKEKLAVAQYDAQAQLEMLQSQLAVRTQYYDTCKKQFESGVLPRSELQKVEEAIAELKLKIAEAEAQFKHQQQTTAASKAADEAVRHEQLALAELRITNAEAEYERAKQLHDQGIVDSRKVDRAETELWYTRQLWAKVQNDLGAQIEAAEHQLALQEKITKLQKQLADQGQAPQRDLTEQHEKVAMLRLQLAELKLQLETSHDQQAGEHQP